MMVPLSICNIPFWEVYTLCTDRRAQQKQQIKYRKWLSALFPLVLRFILSVKKLYILMKGNLVKNGYNVGKSREIKK